LVLTTTDFIGVKENDEVSNRSADSCGVREVFSQTMKKRNREVQDTLDYLSHTLDVQVHKTAFAQDPAANIKTE